MAEQNNQRTADRVGETDQQNGYINDENNLEEQEQINDKNLTEQIERENEGLNSNSGNITGKETMGAEGAGVPAPPGGRRGETEALEDAEIESHSDHRPLTNNLLGDNPPGAEDEAFQSDHPGDIASDQVKYNAENIRENFRENIDKTSSEIDLDKKLKQNKE